MYSLKSLFGTRIKIVCIVCMYCKKRTAGNSAECSNMCCLLIFVFYTLCRAPMEWTDEHDVLMLREMIVSDVFSFKKESVGRGDAWDSIAEKLNQIDSPQF